VFTDRFGEHFRDITTATKRFEKHYATNLDKKSAPTRPRFDQQFDESSFRLSRLVFVAEMR